MNPERRIYPRINVSIPGEVEDATGVSADITILNLSVNGVLIEGDQALAGIKPPIEGAPLEIKLHFGIEERPMHCHCRVVYAQRQSQHCLRYGLTILSIDHEAHSALDSYVMSKL